MAIKPVNEEHKRAIVAARKRKANNQQITPGVQNILNKYETKKETDGSKAMTGKSTSSKSSKGSGSTGRSPGVNKPGGGKSSGPAPNTKPSTKSGGSSNTKPSTKSGGSSNTSASTSSKSSTSKSSKSSGAILGGYKSKYGGSSSSSSSISTSRLDSFNSKPSASTSTSASPSSSVSKPSEPKIETARDIRKAGRLKRRQERKENRTERRTMRREARDERIESRRSSNASIQRVKNKLKAEKQQSRQDQKLKNTQSKIDRKEQKQYDRQLKRNPFLGDQTNASLATSKRGGSGPSYEAAQQEKVLQSNLNKTAFMMKSETPMKMMQNQQGVQGTPYQDVNQMNYNFNPLAQQRAQQMQMPINNSPLNRELVGNQHKLPQEIKKAIKKAK